MGCACLVLPSRNSQQVPCIHQHLKLHSDSMLSKKNWPEISTCKNVGTKHLAFKKKKKTKINKANKMNNKREHCSSISRQKNVTGMSQKSKNVWESEYWEVFRGTVFHSNVCINMISTMSIDRLTQKGATDTVLPPLGDCWERKS